jgi:cellulose synthase/poly-beta-1,6-N-acetylglucosamine synthase-like glycosyltransferase
MPYFFAKSGEENDKIGLVQTPWSYYNMHQNFLTESDALDLDVHHVFEQTGRSWHLKAFGFNGTGGIWRKAAIRDAGGWSSETGAWLDCFGSIE